MPLFLLYTSVLAVPKSIPISVVDNIRFHPVLYKLVNPS
jgi:hypothetical protein